MAGKSGVFKAQSRSRLRVLQTSGQTHFQDAAGKHATSDILKPGMTVKVKYRSVLAGASQASEIGAR